MLISGFWQLGSDHEVRPVIRAAISRSDGSLMGADFLVDSGADQRLHRVEDHRPVVDREQVFVRDRRHGEEPRPQTTRQDDALHRPRSRSPRSSRPRISSGLTATAWAASSSKSNASNVSVSSNSGERAALSGKKATRPRHTPSACRRATSVTIHRLLPCEVSRIRRRASVMCPPPRGCVRRGAPKPAMATPPASGLVSHDAQCLTAYGSATYWRRCPPWEAGGVGERRRTVALADRFHSRFRSIFTT